MAQAKPVVVPDIGDFESVEIIEINVSVGDSVEVDDTLITLETDKASMEVPSDNAGVVTKILVNIGDKVSSGDEIVMIEAQEQTDIKKSDTSAKTAVAQKAPAQSQTQPMTQQASTPPASGGLHSVAVPDLGGFDEVEVIEVNVNPGDSVEIDDTLITLETDKASMEVPSTAAGIVKEVTTQVGAQVSCGDVIVQLQMTGVAQPDSGASAPTQKESVPAHSTAPVASAPAKKPVTQASVAPKGALSSDAVLSNQRAYASPSVRRYASDLGVNLSQVTGSGRKGRIAKQDINQYVKAQLTGAHAQTKTQTPLAPMPTIDFSKFGEIETVALSRINKLSAANLHRNWVNIPHVTQFEDVDMTELEAFRKANQSMAQDKGFKLTLLAFLLKAASGTLIKHPRFNVSLAPDGQQLFVKKYIHIGVAVDTPHGLVVPVIRDVDKKGLVDLAGELSVISQKSRDGKLTSADMQGGCFTISSLGGIGGSNFTPIINAPDVAILGVSRAKMQPVYDKSTNGFVPRLMLPLSLSYDHRVIDGAQAARFITTLGTMLTDVRRLLL